MEDGIEEFLYALREVASAQEGGLQRVAERANLGRESMYKSLSRQGNPRIKTVESILDAVGLELSVSKSHAKASPNARLRKAGHTS